MTDNSGKEERYFHLSINEYGKHFLLYKPDGEGGYVCWEPVGERFYNEFQKLQSVQDKLSTLIAQNERLLKTSTIFDLKRVTIHEQEYRELQDKATENLKLKEERDAYRKYLENIFEPNRELIALLSKYQKPMKPLRKYDGLWLFISFAIWLIISYYLSQRP